MSATRREFIRRMLAASVLLATGAVAVWDILESGAGAQPPAVSLLPTLSEQTSAPRSSTSQQQATNQQSSQSSSRSTSQSSQQTSQQVPPGYILLAPLSALAGKTYAYFNHPTQGLSILVSLGGQWKAFNATCTHQPCTVQYSSSQIQCPCHGGIFDPSNGSVLSGPPPSKLPEMGVIVQDNSVYVSQSVVN